MGQRQVPHTHTPTTDGKENRQLNMNFDQENWIHDRYIEDCFVCTFCEPPVASAQHNSAGETELLNASMVEYLLRAFCSSRTGGVDRPLASLLPDHPDFGGLADNSEGMGKLKTLVAGMRHQSRSDTRAVPGRNHLAEKYGIPKRYMFPTPLLSWFSWKFCKDNVSLAIRELLVLFSEEVAAIRGREVPISDASFFAESLPLSSNACPPLSTLFVNHSGVFAFMVTAILYSRDGSRGKMYVPSVRIGDSGDHCHFLPGRPWFHSSESTS